MSDDKDPTANPDEDNKEYRVLQAMKTTLTSVIKDTATQPGMVHPLSEDTIVNIRNCLMLITARESELLAAAGEGRSMRPRFVDEPETNVVVPIGKIGRTKKDKKPE